MVGPFFKLRWMLGLALAGLLVGSVGAAEEMLWTSGVMPGRATDKAEQITDGHVYNVSVPTLNFFSAPVPEGKRLPVVLVAPGGGYGCLAYEKEGVQAALWLNTLGYHAAVLKYRIPNDRPAALADARRALEILREKADAYAIDTTQMGMLGFSAGAHLTASVLARSTHGLAFALLIYPAYLSKDGVTLAPEVVPAEPTVPTFVVQSCNDRAYVASSIGYVHALLKARRPVAYHLYANGGHGYGLEPRTPEVAQWPSAAAVWLKNR